MTYAVPKQSAGFTPGPSTGTGAAIAASLTCVTTPYISFIQPTFSETINLQSDGFYIFPIYIDETKTYTKIGIRVTNAPGAGSKIQLAIYDQGNTNKMPGATLVSALDLDSSAAGMIEGTISWAATPGWYWAAAQRDTTATVTVQSFGNNGSAGPVSNKLFINTSSLSTASFVGLYGLKVTNTFGTWASNPAIAQNNTFNGLPIIYLR